MSRGLNNVQVIGRLGQDPDLRFTGDGTAVANLSVATNEPGDHTEWHSITCWGDLAEVVNEHVAKGERLYVEGRLRTSEWEDSDGRTRYTTEIHADEVIFLGSGEAPEAAGEPAEKEPEAGGQETFEPDDHLPF
jgi:single-strand DNA-binding protein